MDKTLGYILCTQSPGLFLAALMLAVPAMHVQAAQTDGANDSLRKVKVGYLIFDKSPLCGSVIW